MKRVGLIVGIVVSLFIISVEPFSASAATIYTDWFTSKDVTHEYIPDQNPDKCIKGIWSIEKDPGQFYPTPAESSPHEICVYHQKDFAYAYFMRSYGSYPVFYTESGMAVATGDNIAKGILTPVRNFKPDTLYLPNSSDLITYSWSSSYLGKTVVRYKDFPRLVAYDAHTHSYSLNIQPADYDVLSMNNVPLSLIGFGVSSNGRWLVGASSSAMYRYDLQTNTVNRVARKTFFSNDMWPNPTIVGFSSNDGLTVGIGGMLTGMVVVQLNETCMRDEAQVSVTNNDRSVPFTSACRSRDLTQDITTYYQQGYPGEYMHVDNIEMSANGESIDYYDMHKWHRLSYKPQPVLQYLALGDSFASGEGELFDGNYLPGTNSFGNYAKNEPREMCHESNRAYPMLLGLSMSLTNSLDMRTIACSGAVVDDVLSTGSNINYLGSGANTPWGWKPRLTSITNATALQETARQDFTPGRIQQVEFVKKTKPAVMTIMIGGNDFGFGSILETCIEQATLIPSLPSNQGKDCVAINGELGKYKVQQIISNYTTFLAFYRALQAASPDTKIYAVGYPQFFGASTKACREEAIVGNISQADRQTIRDLTSLANATIKNAALDAGLKYLDIEKSLGNSVLCGDSSAVTGIDDILHKGILTATMKADGDSTTLAKEYASKNALDIAGKSKAYLDYYVSFIEHNSADVATAVMDGQSAFNSVVQELSHPNAKGHQLIANEILTGLGQEGLYSMDCNNIVLCPDGLQRGAPALSAFSGLTMPSDVNVNHKDLGGKMSVAYINGKGVKVSGVLEQGGKAIIQIETKNLGSNAVIAGRPTVSIHSDPINLGKMVVQSDGSCLLELEKLPSDIHTGMHTIHLTGALVSGVVYDFYQTIFVRGPQGDYDGDGIMDRQDTCAFAQPSGRDADSNGIDDECQLNSTAISQSSLGGGESNAAMPIASTAVGSVTEQHPDVYSDQYVPFMPKTPSFASTTLPYGNVGKKTSLHDMTFAIIAFAMIGLTILTLFIRLRLNKRP